MPNIASVIKSEITRLARKEVRTEIEGLKKAVSTYRTEIAALKQRAQALEKDFGRLEKSVLKDTKAARNESNEPSNPGGLSGSNNSSKSVEFSAKDLAFQRRRLGLTIDGCALLLGTAGKSIYRWETGKAQPRKAYWPSLAALRTLSKEQAAEVVAARK
jgi:DNA-binding transcriptional regulator YiaG